MVIVEAVDAGCSSMYWFDSEAWLETMWTVIFCAPVLNLALAFGFRGISHIILSVSGVEVAFDKFSDKMGSSSLMIALLDYIDEDHKSTKMVWLWFDGALMMFVFISVISTLVAQ